MQINISREMAMAVIAALREHIETNGRQDFGPKDEYQVSNEEALEFFQDVKSIFSYCAKEKRKSDCI
jgi:hypothetical protein